MNVERAREGNSCQSAAGATAPVSCEQQHWRRLLLLHPMPLLLLPLANAERSLTHTQANERHKTTQAQTHSAIAIAREKQLAIEIANFCWVGQVKTKNALHRWLKQRYQQHKMVERASSPSCQQIAEFGEETCQVLPLTLLLALLIHFGGGGATASCQK